MSNYKGKVTGRASQSFDKSNGGKYVLHNIMITEGPLAGKTVTGTRTTINAEGEERDPVVLGQEIVVYPRQVDGGKWFFEISANATTSDEDITALLSGEMTEQAQETLNSQAI